MKNNVVCSCKYLICIDLVLYPAMCYYINVSLLPPQQLSTCCQSTSCGHSPAHSGTNHSHHSTSCSPTAPSHPTNTPSTPGRPSCAAAIHHPTPYCPATTPPSCPTHSPSSSPPQFNSVEVLRRYVAHMPAAHFFMDQPNCGTANANNSCHCNRPPATPSSSQCCARPFDTSHGHAHPASICYLTQHKELHQRPCYCDYQSALPLFSERCQLHSHVSVLWTGRLTCSHSSAHHTTELSCSVMYLCHRARNTLAYRDSRTCVPLTLTLCLSWLPPFPLSCAATCTF